MKHVSIATLGCALLLTASACGQQTEQTPIANDDNAVTDEDQGVEPLNVEAGELPPMIERSPSYRCTDGDALYVDVLTDENAVMVRDSRADVPTRLTRDSAGEPFSGDGRTLSGTGSQITYSSPDRPSQTCREAEA